MLPPRPSREPADPLVVENDHDDYREDDEREEALAQLRRSHRLEALASPTVVRPGPAGCPSLLPVARQPISPASAPAGTDGP